MEPFPVGRTQCRISVCPRPATRDPSLHKRRHRLGRTVHRDARTHRSERKCRQPARKEDIAHGLHFRPQQGIPLTLHRKKFHRPPQCHFQLRDVPRLGDVAKNTALIDRADCGVDVGIGGREDLDDVWILIGNLRKKAHTSLPRHPLVCHDDPDLIGVLAEYRKRLDTVFGFKNPKLLAK